MAITTNEIKRMQRDIETLKKKVARLEKRKNGKRQIPARKSEPIAPREEHKQRIETIRQSARRNTMTEAEAMALALQAQHAGD